MTITAWVLDVDDTVYLERDYVRSGFDAVGEWGASAVGVTGVGDTAWQLFLAGTRRSTLTDAFAARGRPLSPPEVAAMVEVYRTHAPAIRPCGDAAAFVATLPPSRLGIVTDGPAASQWAKIRALGLEAAAGSIVVTDSHGPEWYKPAVRAFVHVATSLGVAHERCAYVGDNPGKDFVAARRLGWTTVRITRPGGLHAAVPSRSGEVDREITSFAELAPEDVAS
ncbi:putative hydrolase of the HAD superfamily [Jatrophihabitans endophyticus]|uniref:Putative hydrolase of the HAD superfamily n=1 Tax=Jatrophihabitans endophyticus TaxID=1206085 RepID=A0A1M5INJ6_9ACTN|nr:HAD family hydrolase [Jatrophihabitans endophyticus]SHG29609.1 putative hydrolase of the HAD superfamily [Jatrophihabitans endophyticus]